MLAETIGRFEREAKVLDQLRHSNIVAAYEAGQVGGDLFLVMELAEGVSLDRMISQRAAAGIGRLPVASVLDMPSRSVLA